MRTLVLNCTLQTENVKVHVYFLCADARLVSVETAVQALNIEKSAEEDGFGLDYTIMASLKWVATHKSSWCTALMARCFL